MNEARMQGVWQRVGQPYSKALVDARLELHHAVQMVASIGFSFVPPLSDFSHTAVRWSDESASLVGRFVSDENGFCAALRPRDLHLLLLDPDGSEIGSLPLAGRTVQEGYEWLKSNVGLRTDRRLDRSLTRPDHEIPPHPVVDGARFSGGDGAALEELARWYSNSNSMLQAVAVSEQGASDVECWPHHFDIATLIQPDDESVGALARSIGVGMSPGDGSYADPYFYVTPSPFPPESVLPDLEGGGFWRNEGWAGAVLTTSILGDGLATEQASRAWAFLGSAIRAAHSLIGS